LGVEKSLEGFYANVYIHFVDIVRYIEYNVGIKRGQVGGEK